MKYKKVKIFDGKKILIRTLLKSDLRRVKEFQNYINSFMKEDAQIDINRKVTLKEEINYLKGRLKGIKEHRLIHLVAEHNKIIIGSTGIDLLICRKNHIGNFGITIKKEYRGIGLGEYLSREIIKLAKKELKPSLKIIKLDVLPTNKPAINLYKKIGFEEVAKVPDQIQYKRKLVDEIIMLKYL